MSAERIDHGALLQPALIPLPLGRVKPLGWLKNQLRLQADGLSGHLDEFWPDVARSGWIGGDAEGWERGPYWLDGVVPLAHLLEDPRLLEKVKRWIDEILARQEPDGWLGPRLDPERTGVTYDPWPIFVALKALIQHFDATGDLRIPGAVRRCLRRLDALLDEQPLFVWGKSRWAELVLSIHWLYRRTQEDWLLELAAKARAQGEDWTAVFDDFKATEKTREEDATQITHVVNNAMAIKAPGVWYAQSHDPADRERVYAFIETLDRYHGQVTGVFSGDEHLAGRSPSQGTELCAVVEYMFSLECLISMLGDAALADRLERIAFNALPGTFTADMWAHQYDQQANQVNCVVGPHVWTTNSDDANVFGLEPHFGCCTANFHQGWPKLAAHAWMATPDGGVAAICLVPSAVSFDVDGHTVTIEEETEYPFDGAIRFTVRTEQAVSFPLRVRIPGWADGAALHVCGEVVENVAAGAFVTLERTWRDGDVVTLQLPMTVRCETWDSGAVSVHRGPLVFSLRIDESFTEIRRFGPARDYEVRPMSPWNYALRLKESDPESCVAVERRPLSERPFDPAAPPVVIRVRGRRAPDWTLEKGFLDAAPPPESPVKSDAPLEELILIPYGAAHLRISVFPVR